ncbi:MAG: HAD-IA family hydrolase [Chloroflexi bacterium]|nr:HAD-IA family hydrolase [Chloroflexota bacterium]
MDRILIFDFDGVLADSLAPMLSYAGQVCLELGYPCTPTQKDLEILDKMELSEYGRQLGIPEEKIETFVTRSFELFTSREEPLAITPGIESVIRELSQLAILVVITGNSCKVVEKFLDTYGLTDKFQTILGAEDYGSRVEKILKVISLNGGSNGEVYMIGDAVSDIRAAREAGIKSIAIGWGHQSKERLITENPDFLVDQPEDLLTLFLISHA